MSYLVRGQFVLTMNDRLGVNGIVEDGAVYISGKNIVEIGPYKDLKSVYPTATVIGSSRFWVMPGFVNAHQHGKGLTTFQLGGIDDCFEISRFSPEPQATVEPYIDTLYGCMRMIEAGITTCIHYNSSRGPSYYETDVLKRMRAYQDSGVRVSFGLDIRDRNHLVYGDEEFIKPLPSPLKENVIEKYARSRTLTADAYFPLVKKLSDSDAVTGQERIKLFLTPAGPQWCTEDLLRAIRNESSERDLGIQIHVSETKYQRSFFSRAYQKTAIEWLNDLDFLSPRVSIAHGVWLNRNDLRVVANKGCGIVHNPSSNLRLRSGIAPLPLFYQAGITLGMGLDSSTLNDDSDMLQEIRLAANLQRVPGSSSVLVPLKEIFKMATVNGMNLLRWGDIAGTLEPGKEADLVLLDSRDFAQPYLAPRQNPIDTLIYRGKSTAVDTVIVGGEILYQGRKHKRIDSKTIHQGLKESIKPPSPKKTDGPEAALLPYVHALFQSWDQDTAVPFHKFNSVE
ncbi:MAG: amidohydrolase family protein [Candidatus Binatia bacterium]